MKKWETPPSTLKLDMHDSANNDPRPKMALERVIPKIYFYYYCPECMYTIIGEKKPSRMCPLCLQDCGHDVLMRFRRVTDDDTAELDLR